METVRLSSKDLRCKWGFCDGDLIGDVLSDNGIYGIIDRHVLLIALVKKHLVPLLPKEAEIYEISTNHNPIRLEKPELDFEDVSVEIPVAEVLEMAKTTQQPKDTE